ncbi:MAG: TolC family protein [Spirochaetia bacterium]|nr:TolC family protein [Spirochaetia bacterium]
MLSVAVLQLGLFSACVSDPFKVGDGNIEKPLEEATGVSNDDYKSAEKKAGDASGGEPGGTKGVRGPLTLDEIFSLAVEHTERLAIKQEGVIQAQAQKSAAIGAWIPSLSYRELRVGTYPDHRKNDHEQTQRRNLALLLTNQPAPTSSAFALPPGLGPGRNLVLHIPIFSGLNEYSGIKAANALIKQKENELLHDAGRFYLDVAQAYFTVLQLESQIKSQEEILKFSKQNIDQLQRYVALGRARRADLASAFAQIAQTEASLQSTKDLLSRTREALGTTAGVDSSMALVRDVSMAAPGFEKAQAEELAEKRFDVEAARASLAVAKASVTQAWGMNLPSFYVDGYYGLPQHNRVQNRDIYGQFTFTFPIFSGGQVFAQIKKAESQQREAELSLRLIRRQAVTEIRQAFEAWTGSRLEVTAFKRALDAAELNYNLQADYYARRLGTVLDLLTSLSTLAQARDQYDRAVLQEKLNRIAVGVAAGELPRRGQTAKQTGVDDSKKTESTDGKDSK